MAAKAVGVGGGRELCRKQLKVSSGSRARWADRTDEMFAGIMGPSRGANQD
jgi:hypothetical protein